MSPKDTVAYSRKLRRQIEPFSDKLARSSFIVDLADTREICVNTAKVLDQLVNRPLTNAKLSELSVYIEVELLFHLRYHLRSLSRLLPTLVETTVKFDQVSPRAKRKKRTPKNRA